MIATIVLAMSLATGVPADTSVALGRNGAVEIDTRTRDIVVRTITGDQVTVRNGSIDGDGGTIEVSEDDQRHHASGSGPVEVGVPGTARVEVNSVSGSITLVGTPERMDAETVNGDVTVTGGSGTLQIGSVAGTITVKGFHGVHLSIDATADDVSVTDATGAIEIENVNGAVLLHGIHSSAVSATTVNRDVEFEGDFAPTGRYEFSSQNGDVRLWLPPSVSARMRISTMNGQLDTRIPATTNGSAASRQDVSTKGKAKGDKHDDDGEQTFVVTYGTGAATVTIDAFNGDVIVKPIGMK